MVKVGWYPLIRGWSSILVHRDVCTHFVWIPIMGWMSIPHLIPCNLTMAHMGIAHLYVGNSLVYLHNKFNKSRSTKLILVILTYMTKHELQNYRNISNWLLHWYHILGPPKPYFFRGSSAPIPKLILNTTILWSHKDMMWYIYIYIYIIFMMIMMMMIHIYIYITIIYYIYIYKCFLLPYTCTVGSGSPWVTLDRWITMRLRRTWWARANRPREPQMGWWKIGS